MIRRMLKEEWRMHSSLYSGNSFASFPLIVLSFSLSAGWLTVNYSTLPEGSLGTLLELMGLLVGLAIGSIGFSSRDAIKNVLGPMNLLVYSSRTLPIAERKLILDFIVKDLIYYVILFLLPMAVGLIVFEPAIWMSALKMVGWFFTGIIVSLAAARSTLKIQGRKILKYSSLNNLGALTSKSLLDLTRSSGGMFKIFFSLAILTGFYWFAVLNFPATRKLLTNPLLSFSIILGTLNLSIYNWLNRFDSVEKYIYLPLTEKELLGAKKRAYYSISLPLTSGIVLVSWYIQLGYLVLSLLSALTTTVFTAGVATRLTGLNPNKKLFSSRIFMKYLLAHSLVAVPLLIISILYHHGLIIYYTAFCTGVILLSIYLTK